MSDKPIIFSAPMVQALLAGRKVQTRRSLDPQPNDPFMHLGIWWHHATPGKPGAVPLTFRIKVGDRLWVKETHGWLSGHGWRYRADHEYEEFVEDGSLAWVSSRFMPKRASRITLTVTEVRVQRLQEISGEDAIAEGCVPPGWTYGKTASEIDEIGRDAYANLWEKINGRNSWAANPWVAAYTFSVAIGNIDSLPHAEGFAYIPLGREARRG